jgi:hypothetical protein
MADNPHPTFAVTKQTFTTEPNAQGGYEQVATVHFVTASGDAAHVKIPATHYTARNVHDAVSAMATRMEQVRTLNGGNPPAAENPV